MISRSNSKGRVSLAKGTWMRSVLLCTSLPHVQGRCIDVSQFRQGQVVSSVPGGAVLLHAVYHGFGMLERSVAKVGNSPMVFLLLQVKAQFSSIGLKVCYSVHDPDFLFRLPAIAHRGVEGRRQGNYNLGIPVGAISMDFVD